jgi:hypothetical protein
MNVHLAILIVYYFVYLKVAIDSAKGIDVGEKNHSRKYAAEMTNYFYDELLKEVRLQLNEPLPGTGRPSPVSLIADKYTPNRRTLDIVGGNVYVEGEMETLYFDVEVVKDHTGEGIAKGIASAATKVYGNTEWKTRLISV